MSGLPQRWLELSVRSASAGDRAPLLAEGLLALGGRAAEERGGWYVTHLPEPPDIERFEASARDRLVTATGLADIELRSRWQEHEDWAETWRRGLGSKRITNRIVVRPTWVEASLETDHDIVILLDPGMAFGTAEHGTTRGCLRLLDIVVAPGDRVLDVGSGSGILSIAAARLGAVSVLAVEADPYACETLAENLRLNHVTDQVAAVELRVDHDWLAAGERYSGIVANIVTGVLSPLLVGFREALLGDGWLVLSGIMETEWSVMLERTESAGFRLVETDADGEWRSGLFRKDD